MSPGGKKNVKAELGRCSCFRDHSKSSSFQELPEVIPWSHSVCLCTHTHITHTCVRTSHTRAHTSHACTHVCTHTTRAHARAHTHVHIQRTGCSSGQPAGESPFLDTDALFQEQALTSACPAARLRPFQQDDVRLSGFAWLLQRHHPGKGEQFGNIRKQMLIGGCLS